MPACAVMTNYDTASWGRGGGEEALLSKNIKKLE